MDRRLVSLQREVSGTEERLRRLYRSIEEGIIELDDILRERTASLKSGRERAKAALIGPALGAGRWRPSTQSKSTPLHD